MEQQFFPLGLHGRFFLKAPKKKAAPTPLIFMVRMKGVLYKFTAGVKVYPQQWNQALQKAYISPILSNMDNLNNSIVNKKVEDIKERFNSFKAYLCTNAEYENADLEALLKCKFNMTRQKNNNKNRFDDIIKVIHDAVYNDTTLKQGTIDNYNNKGLPALKFYLEHLKTDNKVIVDKFSYFTTEFFNDFARYIYDNYTHNGEPYTISSINSIIKRLTNILRAAVLLDPNRNTLKIVIATIKKLELDCQYYRGYKYGSSKAFNAFILVTERPDGEVIIQ